jgi:aminoglycoside phosphotransferase (APT) family kinase protein
LRLVARHSPLPIPAPEMIAPHHAYIGYRKLPGAPLVESGSSFCGWTGFPDQIGQFLSAIHRIPVEEVRAVHVKSEAEPWEVLLRDARGDYDRARDLIPRHYSAAIERFFASTPPSNSFEPVFCHNDLGIEHILVTETHVSGVIDWGDTAITDPARDLGLLYRDLGEDVLHRTVDAYTPPVQLSKEHLLDRAVFYAKCRIFENIVYGWNQQRPEYLDTGIQSLQWMFGE